MYAIDLDHQDISVDLLTKSAMDLECSNRLEVLAALKARDPTSAWYVAEKVQKKLIARADIQTNPFNPRYEVSEDARHISSRIVMHLWIILVVIPIALFIRYQMLH